LALDSPVAIAAKRAVEFVVVARTIGVIVCNIEIGGLEGRLAGFAHETGFVVAACYAAVG